MRVLLSLLLAASAVNTQTFLRQLLQSGTDGRFDTLEECEKAYDELLGKVGDEPKEEGGITAKPEVVTTAAPTTEEPAGPKPMVKGEVTKVKKEEAKVTYKPPMSGTGKGSDSEGWDYAKHGADWGAQCSGEGQSPIDITKFVDIGGQTKSVLWFDYYADPSLTADTAAALSNSGHGPFFADPKIDLGYVKIGAEESEAFEYVFHAPSEHTIDGQVYPLELQILHKRPNGELLGVAVLFKNGGSNEFLKAIKTAAPSMPMWHIDTAATTAKLSAAEAAAFNLEAVLQTGGVHPGGDMTFYSYTGSLTSPPCTGGLEWYVSAEPMEASKDEIKHITAAVFGSESTAKGNNRETQDLGSRKVLVGHTGFQHHIKQHGHKAEEPPVPRGYTSQDSPWAGE